MNVSEINQPSEDDILLSEQPKILAAARLFLDKQLGEPLSFVMDAFQKAAKKAAADNEAKTFEQAYCQFTGEALMEHLGVIADLHEALVKKRNYLRACAHPNTDHEDIETEIEGLEGYVEDLVMHGLEIFPKGVGDWIEQDAADAAADYIRHQAFRIDGNSCDNRGPDMPLIAQGYKKALASLDGAVASGYRRVIAQVLREIKNDVAAYGILYGDGDTPSIPLAEDTAFTPRAYYSKRSLLPLLEILNTHARKHAEIQAGRGAFADMRNVCN